MYLIRIRELASYCILKIVQSRELIYMESMAAAAVPSVMINLKALSHYNYEHWRFRVKTYLLAEDLWDLIEGKNEHPKPEDKDWSKRNAKALHAIHISCGDDSESSITGMKTAREAWNKLEEKFGPKKSVPALLHSEENSEVDSNDDNDGDADLVEVHESDETYGSFFDDVGAGRWEAVKEFIRQHPEAVRVMQKGLTAKGLTALSRAVIQEDVDGVKELLLFIKETDLKILEDALHMATNPIKWDTDENTEIMKCIVEKNKKLLVRSIEPYRLIPLSNAVLFNKRKMADYLYSVTSVENLNERDGAYLLSQNLKEKRLDKSLELLRGNPSLGIARDFLAESPLYQLANTHADVGLFLNASQLGIWERWIYNCIYIPSTPNIRDVSIDVQNEEKNQKHLNRKGINRAYQMKLLHHQALEILDRMCEPLRKVKLKVAQKMLVEKALFKAVERGHAPIISHILKSDPSFWRITNEHEKTIFRLAAEHRQDNIFSLLNEFEKENRKYIVGMQDKFGDNMLHAVGKLSQLTQIDHIRGAALQMQKELQWFKKVEGMASPEDVDRTNSDGRTPREVFSMNHRDLVGAGEKAMKETAYSSSFVGALIITIMFATVVTVPGGIKGDTGIPIYLDTKAFQIFIVANVISLCCSTTSVLASLGILTSRFAEKDFLISLPTKLIIGLLTLFISIAGMMIAFSSAIVTMLPEKLSIVIPSIALACVPIASFLWMEGKVLIEIISSTFGYSI
ncbi:uncharacterized protein LOC112185062 isoform X2 [Rosa chinensis]|uniref:uncharacterized protein LOC112185062 isoform X2 n=1 Tax=Rosa chinensis TaxID=74649 RepID=UPI001AD8CA62|nr:uncharacterized protein LOC112185062 isoform X2 [Rosa chinensis]